MDNIQSLETQYLKAKIAYYEGNPFLSDVEFDALEKILKNKGSKVIEQVGSKRKDFDFTHPTKMLSLAKIQTEAKEEGTNYMEEEFQKWYQKNKLIVGEMKLFVSPKFDGNAINIIYRGTKLVNILTRGDGFTGKDITKRFKPYVSKELTLFDLDVTDEDIIEIRAEVVIDVNLFNKKYVKDFANPRNYVAGVIGKDDYDKVKVSELTIIPLHFLVNGKHINQNYFTKNIFCVKTWHSKFLYDNYIETIKSFENLRKTIPYQLDGVVISFPEIVRKTLGENDHDPNWSISIKFVPIETITEVEGIEWNVSKRGEIIPTLLLKPVFLDGSTVKRASGYNAGYIFNKKVWPGAIVSICKRGDIIPTIQKVIVKSSFNMEDIFPNFCPFCGAKVKFDKVHLYCLNLDCKGRIAKQLSGAIKVLGIKRIGEKTIEPFAEDFKNIFEIIKWVYDDAEAIFKYGIKAGSRSQEIFINAFKNIKSLTYEQVIQMLGYDNVGKKISIQLAREHAGLDYDYANLEKVLVEKLRSPKISNYIRKVVKELESFGIKIDKPQKQKEMKTNVFAICMTGSPKIFGYKTKAEFISKFPGIYEVSLSSPECKFLITDSYESTSNKMKTAEKKGIEIKTYGDFKT